MEVVKAIHPIPREDAQEPRKRWALHIKSWSRFLCASRYTRRPPSLIFKMIWTMRHNKPKTYRWNCSQQIPCLVPEYNSVVEPFPFAGSRSQISSNYQEGYMPSGRAEKIIEGDMWMSWFVFSSRIWIGKWGWTLTAGPRERVALGMHICPAASILHPDWLLICTLQAPHMPMHGWFWIAIIIAETWEDFPSGKSSLPSIATLCYRYVDRRHSPFCVNRDFSRVAKCPSITHSKTVASSIQCVTSFSSGNHVQGTRFRLKKEELVEIAWL